MASRRVVAPRRPPKVEESDSVQETKTLSSPQNQDTQNLQTLVPERQLSMTMMKILHYLLQVVLKIPQVVQNEIFVLVPVLIDMGLFLLNLTNIRSKL